MAEATIGVEVVYALPERAWRVALRLPAGSAVKDAVRASGLRERLPELASSPLDCGIFSHPCAPDRVLEDGDRVELYRPLLCDPKEIRRQRAKR
ncbi:MAG TPA: RnfH family protein [Aquimonas sp.]|jgi:putative ubiquitin-RnfH superfamily antitoxin RatB of RatAB toxin-antitoxin module|nr:RnfH family protein [Aquimonas sp.]HRF54724.1 RnfH family protein [Aquimonas sp.]